MRFLVTGGAGFIGSHLARHLVKSGHTVHVFDNLHTGDLKRLADIADSIKFTKADIRDKAELDSAMRSCDGVFHEAALVAVQESYVMQHEYHSVNVTGTENVLELAKRHGARVVYASSSSVYGTPQHIPIQEDALRGPENPYGTTKSDCEIVAQKYMGGKDGVIGLRYFNVYGKGQTGAYAGVITQFMRRLKAGLPPVINGDGCQTRDFVHVSDVAKANLAAMLSDVHDGFFNIGTGKSVTIKDLALIMADVYGLEDIRPEYADSLDGDVRASRADTTLAARSIPWRYSVELEDGLLDMVRGPSPS